MLDPVATTRSPTPDTYKAAIEDLSTPDINAELARLAKSEQKLRETNAELEKDEYRGEIFAQEAVSENKEVLESYTWRRSIIRDELRRRGDVVPEAVRGHAYGPGDGLGNNGEGLQL